jgi:hypothetical protein
MHLEIPHTLGKEEAIRRVDQTLAQVENQPLPAGVVIKNFTKTWTDNVLKVSFWAGKSVFGGSITSTITAQDALVLIDLELPSILKAFVSDSQIEEGVRNKVTPLLN